MEQLKKQFYDCVMSAEEKKDKDWTPVIIGCAVGGLLLTVLVILIVVFVLKSKEPKRVSPSPTPTRIGTFSIRSVKRSNIGVVP